MRWFSLVTFACLALSALSGACEVAQQQTASTAKESAQQDITLRSWAGLQVEAVQFKGIPSERLAPLPDTLALQPNQKLDPLKVRESLRRLYETGLYKTIVVEGSPARRCRDRLFSAACPICLSAA